MFFKNKDKNVEKLNNILKSDSNIINNITEYSEPKEFELKQKTFFSKIIKILLIILSVSMLGFFIFIYSFINKKDDNSINTENRNVKLNIISTNIDIDGKLSYEISIENKEEFNVQYATLELRLPQEFIFLDSDVVADSISNNYMKWTFKNIAPGNSVKLNINGMIFGKVGSEVVMSGSLNYKLDKISSPFTISNNYSILITRSLIDVFIDRPEKIESNKEFDYKIKIRNNSGRVFNNVAVKFGYNNYFTILESTDVMKKNSDGEALFVFDLNKPVNDNISDVKSDDYYQKIITIKGFINNDKISNVELNVGVGIVEDLNDLNNIEYLIQKPDSFSLANSGFIFNVSSNFNNEDINGSKIALINNIDNPYKINLKYKKESDKSIFKNAKILVEFIGDNIFDFNGAKYSITPIVTKNEQSGLIDNTIEWSYGNLNNLKDISISENAIDIAIPFNKQFIIDKNGLKNLIVNLSVYGFDSSNKEILLYKNPSFKISIDSGLSVDSKINYYDENHNQIGFGPNPSKSEQETKYRVDFNINNKYNNLSDLSLTAKLPSNTRYSYEYYTSNGFDILYDENNNTIKWDIKSLNKNTKVSGFFFIYITPTTAQVGKPIQVVDNINIKYNDIDLNREFIKDLGAVLGEKVQ